MDEDTFATNIHNHNSIFQQPFWAIKSKGILAGQTVGIKLYASATTAQQLQIQ